MCGGQGRKNSEIFFSHFSTKKDMEIQNKSIFLEFSPPETCSAPQIRHLGDVRGSFRPTGSISEAFNLRLKFTLTRINGDASRCWGQCVALGFRGRKRARQPSTVQIHFSKISPKIFGGLDPLNPHSVPQTANLRVIGVIGDH